MAKKEENTDAMAWGDYTFRITASNMANLTTLCKYAQMLDFMTNSLGEDQLSIDGVVNEILFKALDKRVKELAKKHGYMTSADLIEDLAKCNNGEEVAAAIKKADNRALYVEHAKILAHVPLDDKQMKLFDLSNGG